LEGLHLSSYDVKTSCLLIQFNPEKIRGGFLITDLLNGLNKPLKFQEVKGYAVFDVIDGKYKKNKQEDPK
jgi:hypothetical protein